MNILFACSLGKVRSKTACHCLARASLSLDYCGVDVSLAERPVTIDIAHRADFIFFMESHHSVIFFQLFPHLSHIPHSVLSITDDYTYMEDKLVWLLRSKTYDFFEEHF